MNRTFKSRLQKVEDELGINDPCWHCEAADGITCTFFAYLEAKGATIPKTAARDLVAHACVACGRAGRASLAGYSKSDRELFFRSDKALAACYRGEISFSEVLPLLEEFIAVAEVRDAQRYGEHYKAARTESLEWLTRFYERPDVRELMRKFYERIERRRAA